MKINIRTKNIELNDTLRTFIEEKIGSLKRFIPKVDIPSEKGRAVIEVNFEVERTTKHHHKGNIFRAEANFFLGGKDLRAEATSNDLKKAIVIVKDELQRSLSGHKNKNKDLFRKKLRELKNKLRR
jgi:ribosomal subunit interface protein